jgi:hypothetical protein
MDKYDHLQVGTVVVLSALDDSPEYKIAWRDAELAELLDNDGDSCGYAHLFELEQK